MSIRFPSFRRRVTIRAMLLINGMIAVSLSLIVALTVFLSSRSMEEAQRSNRFATRVIKDVSDLATLSYAFLLLESERPRVQWQIKNASLGRVLSEHVSRNPEERLLVARLRSKHVQIKRLFDRLSARIEERRQETEPSPFDELNEGLTAQLIAGTEMMANDAWLLGNEIDRHFESVRRISLIFILASASLLMFSAAITTWLLTRSIGGSIRSLAKGARRIAGGDLDYRVAVSGVDELSSFSDAFNEMTGRLKDSYAQLERRANQLARLSSELTLAEQRERRRLSEILHDHLQQLLVGAKIHSEVLSASVGPEKKKIAEEVLNLINQSLQTSRSLTAELSPPILKQGSLSAALQWISLWRKENQGFTVEFEPDPSIDPEKEDITILLFQSVRELLFNTVKHAGVKSARVAMSHNGENLRMDVIDEGSGFDPETIWDKAKEGTGFGLFSIRERMELMGGSLQIESSPGKGTTVSLFAPLETAREGDEKRIQKIMAKAQKYRTSGENIRVLLVDDHTVVRQGLSTMLNLHPDVEVVGEAADGEEAVEKARKLQPDVILMDISMPKMDGVEATQMIHSELPFIRIIGLSMHDKQDQAALMIEAGASAYCTKDGDSHILLSEIRREDRRDA